jgi:hypothetical protein
MSYPISNTGTFNFNAGRLEELLISHIPIIQSFIHLSSEIHFQFEAVGHKEHALDFVVILYFTPSNNFKTGSVRASE